MASCETHSDPRRLYDSSSLSVDLFPTLLLQQHWFLLQLVTVLSAMYVSCFLLILFSGKTFFTITISLLVVTFVIRVTTAVVITSPCFFTIIEIYWLCLRLLLIIGLEILDYFFVKLMPVFSLMPILEPPFSATRYASFSCLCSYFCSFLWPHFWLIMPVFVDYARAPGFCH